MIRMKTLYTLIFVTIAASAHYTLGGNHDSPFVFYYPATILSIIYGRGWLAIICVLILSCVISTTSKGVEDHHFILLRSIAFLMGSVTILIVARSRQEAMRKLNEYIDIRDNFFAMSSHELRTPLTSLKMRLQLRQRKTAPGSPDYEAISGDLVSVNKMVRLISDMLDMSRVNSGKYSLSLADEDLKSILDEAVAQVRPMVPEGRELSYQGFEHTIPGKYDRIRLQQVIGNLVDNSIKYGSGKITIDTKYGAYLATIEISDEGIIPEESKNHIFEKFRRGATGHGGLGLGLFLSREIITLHSGVIFLDRQSKNTRFVIRLPFGS